MTPERVKEIRRGMRMSQRELAKALRMGPNGDRTIRRWEAGATDVTGPASVALELMEKEYGEQA